MKLIHLIGVVDRVTNKVAAVVPDDGSRELYLSADSLKDAREGAAVDLLITPGKTPNDLCQVVSSKIKKFPQKMKLPSHSILVRSMEKTLRKLQKAVEDLELRGEDSSRQVEELQRKIEFLQKGMNLFGKDD